MYNNGNIFLLNNSNEQHCRAKNWLNQDANKKNSKQSIHALCGNLMSMAVHQRRYLPQYLSKAGVLQY